MVINLQIRIFSFDGTFHIIGSRPVHFCHLGGSGKAYLLTGFIPAPALLPEMQELITPKKEDALRLVYFLTNVQPIVAI